MREERGGQGYAAGQTEASPAERWGSSPASSRAQGPSRSSSCQNALGLLPKEFSDFRIACMFPAGNHRKGTGGLPALRG